MTPSSLRTLLPRSLAFVAMAFFLCVLVLAQDAALAGSRTDGQIEMDAVHALDAAPQLKSDLITVATIQGEVTISGTVASQSSKDLAESIVSGVQGVQKVHNNLKVGDPQQAEAAQNEGQPAPGDDQTADTQPAPDEQPQPAPGDRTMDDHHIPQAPVPPPYSRRSPYAYPPSQSQQQPLYRIATGPITVPQGTLLILRNETTLDAKHAKDGAMADFTLLRDVVLGDVLAIPRGATLHGVVVDAKKAGALAGSPELSLKLTSLDLSGQNYPLISDSFQVKGPNKAGHTVGSALAGSMIGAIIGCAAGHRGDCGRDAGIGAGVGAAAGTATAAATPGPDVWIPAETRVTFHLTAPLTVNPVSREEAQRLARALTPASRGLYRRGGPYAYPPYVVARPYGYPYGYPYRYAYPPPVYYRPY